MSGSRIRPRVAVLWNGITLEELGIADLLKSADLTVTLARTRPSAKLPTGKPKVGGASITFKLPNEQAGLKIFSLLYLNPRPMLTMGFGYHGETSYWLAGANVRTRPDMKKFGVVHGYKIDSVSWDYSSQIPSVTLNGMAGRLLGMAEHKRPTIWSGKTLADIAKGISDEHGVTIRISGKVPANQRISHAVQYSGESRVEFLDRVLRMSGATLHTSTMVASMVPGASQAYEYVFEGREVDAEDDHWADDQAQIRTILTIKSIEEEFIDIGTQEQSRPIRIGWAPNLSPAKFGGLHAASWDANTRGYANPPDFVALSIKAVEDNVSRSYPKAAKIEKNGTQQVAGNALDTVKVGDVNKRLINEVGVGRFKFVNESKIPKTAAKTVRVNRVISAVQDDLGGDTMTAAQVAAAIAAQGIKTRITIELNPGAPEISTGVALDVIGTYTHDGAYGTEEVRIVYDENGLKSTLTARPVILGGTDRKTKTPAKSTDDPALAMLDTVKVGDVNRSLSNEVGVGRFKFVNESKIPKTAASDEVSAGTLEDLQ